MPPPEVEVADRNSLRASERGPLHNGPEAAGGGGGDLGGGGSDGLAGDLSPAAVYVEY